VTFVKIGIANYNPLKNPLCKNSVWSSSSQLREDAVTFRTELMTVFENHRKSLIQHCERSELRLHLSGRKLIKNAKNGPFWRNFGKLKLAFKYCYQTGQF